MRLIDADELIIAFEPYHDCDWYTPWIIEKINEAPTVEAVPVVRGEWVQKTDFDEYDDAIFECTNCLHRDVQAKGAEVPYCWFCGADMRGEKK